MSSSRSFVLAEVVDVQRSSVTYPFCPQCFSKVYLNQLGTDTYSCTKCNVHLLNSEVKYRFRLTLVVCDNMTQASITVFGTCLEQFFGCTAAYLHKYLIQIEKEIPVDTDVESLLHNVIQKTFVGRMLLFGFKLTPNRSSADVEQKRNQECTSTLAYVIKNSSSINFSSRGDYQLGGCTQSQNTKIAYTKFPTLIAFQTIDPNPSLNYVPVIKAFKHELVRVIKGDTDGNCLLRNPPLTRTFDSVYNTPISIRNRCSSVCSIQSSGSASFGQQSLMLSCEADTTDESSQKASSFEGKSRNQSIFSGNTSKESSLNNMTVSPVERARARTSVESDNQVGVLEGIDFDQTIDPDATSCGTQADSLIATQSQHLSQANTQSSQFNTEILESDSVQWGNHLELELTGRMSSAEHVISICHKVEKERLVDKVNDTDTGYAEEGSLDDSELLLACNNAETDPCTKKEITEEWKPKSQLKIQDISDSFEEDDSELLLAANMIGIMTVCEELETVPNSESQPNTQLHLPDSEDLDSFLKSQYGAVQKINHAVETHAALPYSEDLFPDSEAVPLESQKTALPDSENLDEFLQDEVSFETKASENCDFHVADSEEGDSNGVLQDVTSMKCPEHTIDGSTINELSHVDLSNDLFSASECDVFNRSRAIPDSQASLPLSNTCIVKTTKLESSNTDRRKSVHFVLKLNECEDIASVDQQMKTTPLTNVKTKKRKSCLKHIIGALNLPFSPVVAEKKDEFLRLGSQDIIFTPSPEIITTALRQLENMSYQSTPLSNFGQSHVRLKSTMPNITKCVVNHSGERQNKENSVADYSCQELFSANSCDLFSTSFGEKENYGSLKESKKVMKQKQACDSFITDKTSYIELFSANSEDLFSNGSFEEYSENDDVVCKKLF